MNARKKIGLRILEEYISLKQYVFLGEGKSSVVFSDEQFVYKVFLLNSYEALSYKRHIAQSIKSIKEKFENSTFFYAIHNIVEVSDSQFVLVYSYEQSEPCYHFEKDEIQNFLVECWQKKLIFQDVKPENFIRVNNHLKWIDYEPDKFTDNLFLNMSVRAFVFTKYKEHSKDFLNKLCRSAINQFGLKELDGIQSFINELFVKIIFQESIFQINENVFLQNKYVENAAKIGSKGFFSIIYQDSFNPEKLFWQLIKKGKYLNKVSFEQPSIDKNNYFAPKNIIIEIKKICKPKKKVSLIIKACVQDTEIMYEAIKHIVSQLSYPNSIDEKILALDIRQNDFLREYNTNNSWNELLFEANRLIDDLVIDKFIFPKETDFEIVNQKWFGIPTFSTHTTNKIPVTAQLFAFEQARNDYILQMDCDVMVGRISKEHSFLNEMIDEIEKNEKVLTVGFNIYKGGGEGFTPYSGFENGGFVPEVRFCLLKKSRIEQYLPLDNEVNEFGFRHSWYRALDKRQKDANICSIRGGDNFSFFIHPQNFKKSDKDVWFTMLDCVEKLQIPEKQIGKFDLEGSYYDWTLSKRNEKFVIVSCLRNIPLSRFLRFWYSLISQTYKDWGLILIDDASENGISFFIKEIIKPFKDRVTFVQNRFRVGVAQNTHKAIHYYMQSQESIVCIIDADDALIGKNVIKNIFEKYTYFEADVVIGKMYRTDKLDAHYKYTPNFINPRLYGGNVWQHIRSFKKYLFDSLNFYDLKIENKKQQTKDILLSRRFSNKMQFPEHCWDFAYMIPITEMSENPMWINHFNLFHDRTTINTPEIKQLKENEIKEILHKTPKQIKDSFKGRKTFLPNLKKIEIDITYECNLKCINCNRSSTQSPIKEGMKYEKIIQFIQESIELGKKWELINLLGGEPTIHKDFLEIVNAILTEYIIIHSPDTILQITSNGFGELVQEKLEKLPKHQNLIVDYASFKDERIVPYFSPFNDAPMDRVNLDQNEYHKGCWVTSYCGIGLNQLGYYPCGVAGGIDRVFEHKLGIQSLKDVDKSISKLLAVFCKYCGNFTDYESNQGDFIPRNEKAALTKPIISETWQKAYKKYNGR
jgi:Glycosyl transferase family 2/4Fe-4S single cluster domain